VRRPERVGPAPVIPIRPLLGAIPVLILVAVILLDILFVGRRRRPCPPLRPRPCPVISLPVSTP
jgi:hypothetical protein